MKNIDVPHWRRRISQRMSFNCHRFLHTQAHTHTLEHIVYSIKWLSELKRSSFIHATKSRERYNWTAAAAVTAMAAAMESATTTTMKKLQVFCFRLNTFHFVCASNFELGWRVSINSDTPNTIAVNKCERAMQTNIDKMSLRTQTKESEKGFAENHFAPSLVRHSISQWYLSHWTKYF